MIPLILLLCFWAIPLQAEIRVDPARSIIQDGWWRLHVQLGLSDITPYRVFTLDDPRRLVVVFDDVVWDGIDTFALLEQGRASSLRVVPLQGGQTQLVIDLAEPLAVVEAGMKRRPEGADLAIVMKPISAEEFAVDAEQALSPSPAIATAEPETEAFVVVIDPGHGGLDPGANRGGVLEADLMLQLGLELNAMLSTMPGISPIMTRDADVFVPLHRRITFARTADADLLISLHADALEQDAAQGASVYTLTIGGGDTASARMVERHERGDLLAGVDLSGQGDRVATSLMELARRDTGPAGMRFADVLVEQMRERGVRLNARPLRQGQLAVLSAADFPSVLIEAGFLSSRTDRARLTTQEGRAPMVQAIADAVKIWAGKADR